LRVQSFGDLAFPCSKCHLHGRLRLRIVNAAPKSGGGGAQYIPNELLAASLEPLAFSC
jgi:hypothetical protein